MRIRAPRSTEPSPVRTAQNRSTFRAPSCSSDEEDWSSEEDSEDYDLDISVDSIDIAKLESSSSSSSDEEDESSDGEPRTLQLQRQRRKSTAGDDEVEETIAAIRSRVRHHDPYDEWERQTRKDAFQIARKHQAADHTKHLEGLRHARAAEQKRIQLHWTNEINALEQQMKTVTLNRHRDEQRLLESWRERDRKIWESVEATIKKEEEKLRLRLEQERRAQEEAERRRKEEEEKRLAAERKRREEEAERLRKENEERERKRQEEEDMRKREAAENEKLERERGAEDLRKAVGMPRADDFWLAGLKTLHHLKTVTMRVVKGPERPNPEPPGYRAPPAPPLKKLWSAQRRKITPKVGQLTDDPREIARITEELKGFVAPMSNIPADQSQHLHHALLSSLAKAFIAQAEAEVTAHKEQAIPLARVAVNLIVAYPLFGDILWAKLCELIGCWAAGVMPRETTELEVEPGRVVVEKLSEMPEKQRLKRVGARVEEGLDVQMMRITGVLRLYFTMLFEDSPVPLPPQYRRGRLWAYLAQMLSDEMVLKRPIAPEAIYVALDVGGTKALTIWGKQFIKMLKYIYEGVQGPDKERFGGTDVLAQAARARCQLEVEKIMVGARGREDYISWPHVPPGGVGGPTRF